MRAALKERGYRQACLQLFVVKRKCCSGRSIRSDNTLVFIRCEQQSCATFVRRHRRDYPGMAKILSKQSLFHGARSRGGGCESHLLRAIRSFGGNRGYVQHTGQFAQSIEDRRSGACQFAVTRTVVLPAMNQHRPLFSDASPNAVCAFNLFGPNAPEPNPPMFEVFGPTLITAVMDRHAVFVA